MDIYETNINRRQTDRLSVAMAFLVLSFIAIACGSDAPKSKRPSSTPEESYTPSTTNSDKNNNNSMTNTSTATGFAANLPTGFRTPTDDAGRLLLKEYGAVFVARGVAPPKTVVFRDQAEVSSFQSGLSTASESIGNFKMELQSAAMEALQKAITEARSANLTITPRDKDSARRSYDETIELWASRVDPALKHWVSKGRLTQSQADKVKSLTPYEQVPEVLRLEAQGIYFAKDLSKSIIYSVAPPGTSQHLSMLAFDINEHENSKVREILAKHNWYQTVVSDLPHFTYLGTSASELPRIGLKKITDQGREFWVPEL